jgi:DNA polymerase III subunit delta'
MTFSSIPGSDYIKEKLIQSVKAGKMPHAQLFEGNEGALNLPLALAYATYLHCENKGDTDACGVCAACSKNLKYIHPDTSFVFPVGNIKGDKDEDRFKAEILKQWRAFLLEQPFGNINDWATFYGGEDKQAIISREESREIIKTLSLKPFESPFKVMIIWQPEYMHPSAANGILKILEEPPPNTFFILVTNAAERLLPTIISRTQIVQVPMLSDEDIENALKEKAQLDELRISEIIQLADGNLNLAYKLIDQEEDHNHERFSSWMRACFKKDYQKLVGLSEDFHEVDKLSQRNFLLYSLSMLREVILNLAGAKEINRTKGNELKFVQDFSKVLDVEKIGHTTKMINEASYFLERNGSAKMIFLDLSLQLSKTINP